MEREKAIEILNTLAWVQGGPDREEIITAISMAIEALSERTGEWVQISPAKMYECSKCGQNVMTSDIEAYKFCHGCGAMMRREDGE